MLYKVAWYVKYLSLKSLQHVSCLFAMMSVMAEKLTATKRMFTGGVLVLALAACGEKQTDADAPQAAAGMLPDTVKSGQVGYDVSWPQGDSGLRPPKNAAFVIVGLNHDVANDWNQHFGKQSADAAGMYVHTANAGSKQASKWPDSGKNRYGTCEGDDNLACDYEYGRMLAEGDLKQAAKYGADSLPVWLDVEVENYSWQKKPARNRAALEGMVKVFTDNGNPVGIYSDAESMRHIAGKIPSDSELSGLPNWILGAGVDTKEKAQAHCDSAGFTGQVVLAQMAGDKFPIDRNLAC